MLTHLIYYFVFCFIEDKTCLTCFSEGVLPICLNISLMDLSSIGGFFSKYLLNQALAIKKPATAPINNAPIPIVNAQYHSIIYHNSFHMFIYILLYLYQKYNVIV